MGQIVGLKAKPKRCNLNKLSQLGIPDAGEYILVSYDNSMTANGQGNFDRYIMGDGRTAATALELKYLDDSTRPYIVEEVNKAVADIQPIEITGDVTNAPDEEDLTSENQGGTDVLKFKDKAYNSALYSGLGRTYLRKNIVTLEGTGKNVLTQAMVNSANTIYHIQYDYDLNGETITLPTGCVLEFDGGSISNGTVTGSNTGIDAGLVKIFGANVTLNGIWNIAEAYPEWFGAIGDEVTDDAIAINKAININTTSRLSVLLSCKTYLISPDVIIFNRDNVCLIGNNAKVISRSDSDYSHLIYADKVRSGITIEGITFDNTGDEFDMPTSPSSNHTVLSINGNNACVRNCDVYFYGVHGIGIYTTTGNNARVENNNLFFSRKGTNSYDCSAIYVEAVDITISKNHIDGKYNSDSSWVFGGIEAHGDEYIVTDNIVENCLNGINLVNHQSDINNLVPTDGKEGKLVCDNIISKVSRGIVIWSILNSNPVENLRITNNSIKLIPAGTFGIGTSYLSVGKINKLWITGNTITGDASAEQYPNQWDVMGLICFCCCEVNGLTIKDNTISNSMHAGVYIGTTTENSFVRDIVICDNTFIDCACYTLQYRNSSFPYYSHDVIYCKDFYNLSIRDNRIIYNKSVSLVDYLVNLDGNYDFAEVIGNNALCLYDTKKEGVKEEIGTCHFDYSKVRTDMEAYLDFLPAENRVYQNKVVTSTSTSLSIPAGTYRQGDKVIFSNNICLIFKDSYSTLGALTSGDLSATYTKLFIPYTSGLSYFHVGMPISIPNAIGGLEVKHTVVKKASNYISFSEDIPISSSTSSSGSVRGYKSFVPKVAIGALTSLPTLTSEDAGFNCFHTTSGKPVWWNGTAWVDATGAAVQ